MTSQSRSPSTGTHERSEPAPRTPIRQVVAAATADFGHLTGRAVESVSGVAPEPDGYRLSLEVIELERVPASTNLMGSYDVLVDGSGSVIEFARIRRYHRNQADEDQG